MKAKVRRQAADVAEDGVRSSLRMVTSGAGGAAHAIADVARDENAEVIVVGTRGHTAVVGLIARQRHAATAAHCPVPSAVAVPGSDHSVQRVRLCPALTSGR